MTDNFSNFMFSIFIGCSFSEFSDAVMQSKFYNGLIKNRKAHLKVHDDISLSNYFNPEIGGVLQQFTWWTSKSYPNMVFLSSNQSDGLYTGCFSIQNRLKCTCISFSVSGDKNLYPNNHFHYISSDEKERVVIALKEDRWTFYQQGEPLPFENLEYYNRRRIKDRINFDTIKEYLLKLGIDFYNIDTSISDCTTYIRTEWGC